MASELAVGESRERWRGLWRVVVEFDDGYKGSHLRDYETEDQAAKIRDSLISKGWASDRVTVERVA